MNVRIPVENQKEGEEIRAGLRLPDVRAFVRIMGQLDALPNDRSRERVLRHVWDMLVAEPAEIDLKRRQELIVHE